MGLRILYGRSGSGKSTKLYQDMIAQAMEHANKQYMVIVPEQFTMQTQKNFVSMHPNGGVMNIDIVSFQRLAYRIFEEVGTAMLEVLDDTGKSLILRSVVEAKKDELHYFRKKIHMPGFIEEMKSVLSEFFQYSIYEDRLEQMLELSKKKPLLHEKMKDIVVLYQGFREYLSDNQIASEELLEVLCKVIPKSRIIQGSVLLLDGFTGFTPVQYQLLELLMVYAEDVWVTITMDEQVDGSNEMTDLFYMSKVMADKCKQCAMQAGVSVEEHLQPMVEGQCRFWSKQLFHVEQCIFQERMDGAGQSVIESEESVKIYAATNPVQEAGMIVEEIERLVRSGAYRYRDIAVVTGDMGTYHRVLSQVCQANHIPCFIDHKRNIVQNPYVQWIQSIMEMIEKDFRYESVFHYLKCGLVDFTRDEVDLLENYVIANGIKGYRKWNNPFTKPYPASGAQNLENPLAYVNGIREKMMSGIEDLRKVLKSKKSTVKKCIQALYECSVAFGMEEKLNQMKEQFEVAGDQSRAMEYDQSFGKVVGLFEQVVQLMGDSTIPLSQLQDILKAGFLEIKVGIIPPGVDCVLVGDMERTRLNDIKVLFVAGANDGIIPKAGVKGGIISESERVFFKDAQIELSPTARENVFTQRFYLYLNLTKAGEKLYLSYSNTSLAGRPLRPSYIIANIQNLFSDVCVQEKKQIASPKEAISFSMVSDYVAQGIANFGQQELQPLWKELYSYYKKHNPQVIEQMIEEAYKNNEESVISASVVQALYGKSMQASVTRLEKYASCAFAHFLTYGLALVPRQEYKIDAGQLGSLYHRSIEKFSKKMQENQLSWKELNKTTREKLVKEVVEELVCELSNTAFFDSARNAYMVQRVERITNRTIWALCHHLEKSKFQPSYYEFRFSTAENTKAAAIRVNDEVTMDLKGIVDRVDLYREGSDIYVKIIDYKTGSTKFDLVDVYYGMQMQLVVYLDAVMEAERESNPDKNIIPAGVFYYNVKDPLVDAGEEMELAERVEGAEKLTGDAGAEKLTGDAGAEKLSERAGAENLTGDAGAENLTGDAGTENLTEDGRQEQDEKNISDISVFKMTGLVNQDELVIDKFTDDFNENDGGIPVSVTKSGALSKNSSVGSTRQIEQLIRHVKDTCVRFTSEMIEGHIEKNPYSAGQINSCTYCDYRGVCKWNEKEMEYRTMEKLSKDDVWRKISQNSDQKGGEADE